jgi:membrane protease YdiL (CAAX protease family)
VANQNTVSPLAAVLAVIASFLLLIFVGGTLALLLGYGPALILSELLVIVVPLTYMLSKHVDIKTYIGSQIKPGTILRGVALGGALLLFDIAVSSILTPIIGTSQAAEESNTLIKNLGGSPLGLLSVAIGLSLAGVCEEFTFRAFLLNTINRKYSFLPALLVSSAAWGLFHFDPQMIYFVYAFLAGLVLGYIYHRWNSYVTSAITHATYNLIVLAILMLA